MAEIIEIHIPNYLLKIYVFNILAEIMLIVLLLNLLLLLSTSSADAEGE